LTVSIPHRFNSHYKTWLFSVVFGLVSIPHRFNSHLIFYCTYICPSCSFNPSQVQFTHLIRLCLKNIVSFQSLTGSIHTISMNFKSLLVYKLSLVSIPHRFNSHNSRRLVLVESRDKVLGFNPSQVQFTHLLLRQYKIVKIHVSIPHRFNSHK
jgi:hypothetical protein